MSIKNSEFLDLYTSDFLSDHCTTEWLYIITRPNMVKTRLFVRSLKKSSQDEFARDLDLAINENIHYGQSLQELMMVSYQLLKQLWTCMHQRKGVLKQQEAFT